MGLQDCFGFVIFCVDDKEVELDRLVGEIIGYVVERRLDDPSNDGRRDFARYARDHVFAEVRRAVDVIPFLQPPLISDFPCCFGQWLSTEFQISTSYPFVPYLNRSRPNSAGFFAAEFR